MYTYFITNLLLLKLGSRQIFSPPQLSKIYLPILYIHMCLLTIHYICPQSYTNTKHKYIMHLYTPNYNNITDCQSQPKYVATLLSIIIYVNLYQIPILLSLTVELKLKHTLILYFYWDLLHNTSLNFTYNTNLYLSFIINVTLCLESLNPHCIKQPSNKLTILADCLRRTSSYRTVHRPRCLNTNNIIPLEYYRLIFTYKYLRMDLNISYLV